jgi:hypothetical protein
MFVAKLIRRSFAILLSTALSSIGHFALAGTANAPAGPNITIQGKAFYKDGKPWLAKGIDVNAFAKPPKYFSSDKSAQTQRGYWGATELKSIKEKFGADTIRFHISQAGLDPQSSLYDPVYVSQILEPFELARQSGFAIILVMDAQQDGMPDLKCMPSASTERAWKRSGLPLSIRAMSCSNCSMSPARKEMLTTRKNGPAACRCWSTQSAAAEHRTFSCSTASIGHERQMTC